MDEGVASIEDTDRGAKIGLRWTLGPFEIMNRIGIDKTYAAVAAIGEKYPDFKVPELLKKQKQLGKPFEFNFVDVAVKDGIATLTLNRPEAMNALNEQLVAQLGSRFAEAEGRSDVKAIVIQGAGKAFVAGADIRYFVNKIKAERISDIVDFTRKGHEVFLKIENSSKLTIALLDGLSLGGGSELALACQAIVATSAGSMAFPETGIGIYPGLGGMLRTDPPGRARAGQVLCVHRRAHQRQGRQGPGHRAEAGGTRGDSGRHSGPGLRRQTGQIPVPESSGQIQTACGHVYGKSRRILAGRKTAGRRIRRQRRKNAENHRIQSAAGP